MLFNSYSFILCFLPVTLAGYYYLGKKGYEKAGKIWLVAMSLCFHGYLYPAHTLLLCASIGANYMLLRLMVRMETAKKKHLILAAALFVNLGILFYYKYFDFLISNVNALCHAQFPLLGVLLPLGISFFTFQQLSLLIDCYRGKAPCYTLLDYAAYVTFFPQLIAGPIVLHTELIPQLCDSGKKKAGYSGIAKGLYGFSLGLAKKVLIADTFSRIVTAGYADILALDAVNAWITVLCYTFQVYFDFSGYCDMALGIGHMFGITLPVNFNSPYKATSVMEFWDRWHMTLTRFFTQYVYIPLGGSRRGKLRMYANTLAVFAISGLWHGANWTFIVWGCLYGIFMVLNKAWEEPWQKLPRFFRWGITFLLVNLLWVYFRAGSIADAHLLFARLFAGGVGGVSENFIEIFGELTEVRALYRLGLGWLFTAAPYLPLLLFLAAVLAAAVWMRNTQEKMERFTPCARTLFVTSVLMAWCVLSLSGVSEFLYFNF